MQTTNEEQQQFERDLRNYDKQFKYDLGLLTLFIILFIIAYCFYRIEYVVAIPLLIILFSYNLGHTYYCYHSDIQAYEKKNEK